VYVCICNGFTDVQVRSVCEQQKCRVSEVYKALGCAPKCGKCVPTIRELARVQPSIAAFVEAAAA
jgi:bacterioferritin-associated ferredoxin